MTVSLASRVDFSWLRGVTILSCVLGLEVSMSMEKRAKANKTWLQNSCHDAMFSLKKRKLPKF